MMTMVKDLAVTIVCAYALTGITYILPKVSNWAEEWLKKLQDEADENNLKVCSGLFETANRLLQSMVYHAVAAMEQTKAADIREKVKAGKMDRSNLLILASDVLYAVKEQLTPDMKKILGEYIVDLDAYISNLIESSLLGIKRSDWVATIPEAVTAETMEVPLEHQQGTDMTPVIGEEDPSGSPDDTGC